MLVDNSYQSLCEIEYTTHLPEGKGMQQKNRGLSDENLRNLRECRKFLRFKHAEMAAALGIPQSTYASYESGARKVPPEILEKARIIAIQDGRPYPVNPPDAETVREPVEASYAGPSPQLPPILPEAIEEAVRYVDDALKNRPHPVDLGKKAKLIRLLAEELSDEIREGRKGEIFDRIKERYGTILAMLA